ncbi:MAG: hypothetical protein LBG58_13180 [Planctomycetaceae bacterium]|jgi:replicative DNA helicase|nr:hypothetical protein [Planctomycetaceae bacterium]
MAHFFGDSFSRDSLIGFLAAEKSGKSMMLLDIAWRAVREKHKVAFFEVGDMSQNQVMLRLMAHITGIPKKHGRYKYPTSLRVDRKHNVEISHDERKIKEGEELSADDAISECRKLLKKHGDNEFFRLSVHPNNSIGVLGIESRLDMWERSGWMPDVIVIDYADLLIPPNTRQEKRYQVDETWKQLRGLSQSRHCLVVTATQADAASYRAKILDKSNFSESKTKLAHVTGMIGINASQSDRDKYIRRLNWIVRREAEYNELECLYIAGCLAMCRPMILGFLLTVH